MSSKHIFHMYYLVELVPEEWILHPRVMETPILYREHADYLLLLLTNIHWIHMEAENLRDIHLKQIKPELSRTETTGDKPTL